MATRKFQPRPETIAAIQRRIRTEPEVRRVSAKIKNGLPLATSELLLWQSVFASSVAEHMRWSPSSDHTENLKEGA